MKPVTIPKITILVDHGYHPETIQKALQIVYPQIMTEIRFERSPKPSKAEKVAQGQSGFVPVATRWVVERSDAWMQHCKSLGKNFEWTLDHARAKLNPCFIRLMLKDQQTKITPMSFPRRRESMISLLLEPVSYFNATPLSA